MAQSKESLQPNSPTSNLTPQTSISLSHHQRRCSICRHPDRHWIEEDFLRWRSPWDIKVDYDLADRSSIYRHARAFGLLALRKHNLRSALELLIEQVEDVKPSASAIVRAIRAYTRLTDDGEWIHTPNHTIITHTTAPAPPNAAHTPSSVKHSISSFENAPEATARVPQPQLISSDASSSSDFPSPVGAIGVPGPELEHPVHPACPEASRRERIEGGEIEGSKAQRTSGLQTLQETDGVKRESPSEGSSSVVPAASSNSPDAAFRSLAAVVHKVRATLAQNKGRAHRRQSRPRRAKSPQNETKSSSTR